MRCLDEHVDDVVHGRVVHEDLQPRFRYQVDGVLGAPIDLGMALLAAVAAGLGHRHAVDAEPLQGRPHLVQLERFDHRCDELHDRTLRSLVTAMAGELSLGPAAGMNSYAASACTARSMPPTSSSTVTRNPMVRLISVRSR